MKTIVLFFSALLFSVFSTGQNSDVQHVSGITKIEFHDAPTACDIVGSITGPAIVCRLVTGVGYSITAVAGATSYVWTAPTGAVISTGQGTTAVTVDYPAGSSSGNMAVYAVCPGGQGPSVFLSITVLGPILSGNTNPCRNTTVTYTTETGMGSTYVWTWSGGVTWIAGGGASDATVTLKFPSSGSRWVKVQYTNGTCTSNTTLPVTVHKSTPSLTGASSPCLNDTYIYTTDSGMNPGSYVWNVSPGNTITAGGGTSDNTITITWNAAGAQWVSVTYSNPYGCAIGTTTYPLSVNHSVATWSGGTSSDWNSGSNWNGGIVPGICTDVTIPSLPANQPTIGNASVCHNLIMESGATLLGNNNLTVYGTTTVKRNITGNGINPATAIWHYASSPVSVVTANTFLGGLVNHYYEPTMTWMAITDPATSLFPGKGYSIAMPVTGDVIFTGGQLNSGDLVINNLTFTGANANYSGWHLVGNPFASPVNWNIGNWNRVNLDATVYTWNGTQYVCWPSGAGFGTLTNGIIPAEQGFLVHVRASGLTGSITIPEAARLHNNQGYYKTEVSDLLGLEITGNGYSDKAFIHFNPSATGGFDPEYDAYKLFGIDEAPQIYSIMPDNNLAVNVLPDQTNQGLIQLGTKVGVSGTYIITASDIETFPDNIPVYLEDQKEGVFQNLRTNAIYSFTSDPGDNDQRFMIHFWPLGLPLLQETGIRIFSYNNEVYIGTDKIEKAKVIIYNLVGQEIIQKEICCSTLNKFRLQVPQGYYLVKVFGINGLSSAKVFINQLSN